MTSAFNLDNLQVLKLRNCDYVLEFLHNLVRFGHNLKLRSFELVYRRNQSNEDALLPFLLSLHGLEEAYITEVPIDDISRKHITLVYLLTHKSSVKRLICDEPVRALSCKEAIEHERSYSMLLSRAFQVKSLKCVALHRPPLVLGMTYFQNYSYPSLFSCKS
jgi:hypothetical protein